MVFLSSNNREIVKSTLGYIKLAIHTLPVDLLKPHLAELVPALLSWSHDHKNHFKAKVRHIFERMIRRFGWEDIYSAAGKEEAAKVLVNIKKRKDRAKRKKTRAEGADSGEKVFCFTFFIRCILILDRWFLEMFLRAMHLKTCCMAVKVSMKTLMMKGKSGTLPQGVAKVLCMAFDYALTMMTRWISSKVLHPE